MNESGIKPLDLKVLVLPEEVKEKTEGGIFLPDDNRNKEKYAQIYGTLVAIGSNAFYEWIEMNVRKNKYLDQDPDSIEDIIPQIGDKVAMSKYAGKIMKGKDGKEYRLCNDADISAVMEESK